MLSLVAALLQIFCAGFVAGCFATSAFKLRRARLDVEALVFLSQHPGASGLDLIDAKLGHQGTVYPRLRRLEDKGLLASQEEEGGPERNYRPRRRYQITSNGLAWLAIEVGQMLTPQPRALARIPIVQGDRRP